MIEPHPLVVHFPIGLLFAAGFFLLGFLATKKAIFQDLCLYNLLLGVIGAAAAVITGLLQEDSLVHNDTIHDMMELHESLGYVVLGLFAVLLIWKFKRRAKMKWNEQLVFAAAFYLGLGVLGYSGHLGGQMVYQQGAGVEPMKAVIQAQEAEGGHHHHHEE